MASLLNLPPELLEQIISVLTEGETLSTMLLHEEPSDALLQSGYHPLKDLSLACRATRQLCFPRLFSAIRVDINNADQFLRFAETNNLFSRADSLLLYPGLNLQAQRLSSRNIWLPMVRVINSTLPSVVTVVLTPSLFQKIVPYEIDLSDDWAFRIPCQVLQLRMPRDLAALSKPSREALESQNLFQIREWTHCTFNHGSFVNVYSNYEYYLKKPPSLFRPLDYYEVGRKMTDGGFANLTSLDYIAVFPIDHMSSFCRCIESMKKLKCLRVQFAPTLSNNVLDDPVAMGKCQHGDLWLEFAECYKDLTAYIGGTSDAGTTSIEEFISLDYVHPSLRELLDRIVGKRMLRNEIFMSDSSGGRWFRTEESPKCRPLPSQDQRAKMSIFSDHRE